LLDTLRAATTKEVDSAIEKAKAAQLKWRTTTFKQRILVLKTLLKFILDNQGNGSTCIAK
jgi:acyl-CoA reductase-like NAD-dependent aldehyde dehydrogenase